MLISWENRVTAITGGQREMYQTWKIGEALHCCPALWLNEMMFPDISPGTQHSLTILQFSTARPAGFCWGFSMVKTFLVHAWGQAKMLESQCSWKQISSHDEWGLVDKYSSFLSHGKKILLSMGNCCRSLEREWSKWAGQKRLQGRDWNLTS